VPDAIFWDDDAGQGNPGSPGSDGASPYQEGSGGASPYRDLAMAAEIGWRPAPNGEPGMGVRTPLEAIR
jgi:hypothetical protein